MKRKKVKQKIILNDKQTSLLMNCATGQGFTSMKAYLIFKLNEHLRAINRGETNDRDQQ